LVIREGRRQVAHVAAPARARQRRLREDRERGGFAALELVILLPFVIIMLLLVVAFGRVSRGRQLVDQAAQAASRAASLSSSPEQANSAAQAAATQTLTDGGLSCTAMNVTVDTSQFFAGGQVIARVQCRTDLSGLTVSGVPGSVTLTTSSTSPLETYRQFAQAAS
jgi:Flp pilus assembly protein TadG